MSLSVQGNPPPRPCPTVKALSARPLLKISQGETEAMPAMQLRVAKKKNQSQAVRNLIRYFICSAYLRLPQCLFYDVKPNFLSVLRRNGQC